MVVFFVLFVDGQSRQIVSGGYYASYQCWVRCLTSTVIGFMTLTVLLSLRLCLVVAMQFLGGDMAHTHLVKGLDFALLERSRAELEKARVEAEEAAQKGSKGKGKGKKHDKFDLGEPDGEPTFNTALGYSVFALMMDRAPPSDKAANKYRKKKESPFLPGHMCVSCVSVSPALSALLALSNRPSLSVWRPSMGS